MARNNTIFQESLRRAHNFAWDRQWPQAIAEYRRALAEFDNDPVVWISLGLALSEARRLPDAKDAYRRASDLQPENLAVQQKLGEIYEKLGEVESALQAYFFLANGLQKSDSPASAVDAWRSILRLQPAHFESRMALADLLERLKREAEAAQENVMLARLLYERGRAPEALERARHALELDSRNGEARALITSLQSEAPLANQPVAPAPLPVVTDYESPLHDTAQRVIARLAEDVLARGRQSEVDTLLANAVELQSRGKLREAIEAYQRALARGAQQPEVHFNLGALYVEFERDDDAIREFSQTVNVAQFALGSHFGLGRCYRARGEIGLALEHLLAVVKAVELQSAKRADADSLEQLYRDLLSTVRRGANNEAVTYADNLIALMSGKQWKQKFGALRARLDALVEGGARLSVAELLQTRDADQVLSAMSDSHEYLRRGMFVAAVDECYRGIALAPSYVPLHSRLAEIYSAQGRPDAAVAKYAVMVSLQRLRGETVQMAETYRHILTLNPQDVEVRTRLVELLCEMGEFAEAVEQCIALGQAHYQQAQPERALSAYQNALALIPRAGADRWSQTILHHIGEIHMQRVEWKEAATAYQQIRRIAPDDDKASLRLIEVYFKLDRETEMEKELEYFIRRHQQAGDVETVLPIVTDTSRLRPRNGWLRHRLVDLLLDLGRMEDAIRELDTLGEIQLSAGQKREAIETIERIVTLEPRNVDEYRSLLAQLREGR